MSTPVNEKEFAITIAGDTTGEQFAGKFKVRTRLSFRDQLRRDEIRRTLLGVDPSSASERADSASVMLSELSVRVIEAPSWWTNAEAGLELADDNVLREVYLAAIKAEKDLIASVTKKGEEAQADLQKAAAPAAAA